MEVWFWVFVTAFSISLFQVSSALKPRSYAVRNVAYQMHSQNIYQNIQRQDAIYLTSNTSQEQRTVKIIWEKCYSLDQSWIRTKNFEKHLQYRNLHLILKIQVWKLQKIQKTRRPASTGIFFALYIFANLCWCGLVSNFRSRGFMVRVSVNSIYFTSKISKFVRKKTPIPIEQFFLHILK